MKLIAIVVALVFMFGAVQIASADINQKIATIQLRGELTVERAKNYPWRTTSVVCSNTTKRYVHLCTYKFRGAACEQDYVHYRNGQLYSWHYPWKCSAKPYPLNKLTPFPGDTPTA